MWRLLSAALIAGAAGAQSTAPLTLEKRIPLSGVKGRIDHFTVDVPGERLFVAALGNNTVEVVDLKSGKRTQTIQGVKEPQGLYYDPESKKLFAASGGDGSLKIFEGANLSPGATVQFSGDADNVRYDRAKRRAIVGYGDGALGIIENGSKLADIPLPAHPESFQLARKSARIFVNVPRKNMIAVADRDKNQVTEKWPVTSAHANYPMALDEDHNRLFTGCRHPAKLLVWDTQSGQQVAAVDIPGDTDDLFYDAAKQRIYVIGGEGAVSAIQQVIAKDLADRYEPVAKISTAPGARTGLFVPEMNRLFVAVPLRGTQKCELLVFRTR